MRMKSRRLNFEEISFSKTVRGKCYSCGKKVQRTFREGQTVNPFNKNEHGEVKTREEIIKDVKEILNNNTEDVLFVCKDCEL